MSVLSLQRFPVDEGRLTDFESAVGRLLAGMRAAAGNLWADAARAFDDDPSFIVLGEWRGEADADAWDASGEASRLGAEIDPLLRGDATMRRLHARP